MRRARGGDRRRRAGRHQPPRVALADAGLRVTLFEARPRLGGADLLLPARRADRRQRPARLPALLHRLPRPARPARRGRPRRPAGPPRHPGRSPRRAPRRLRRSGLPAPLHLLPALPRYRLLSPAERLRACGAALALRRLDPADPALDRTESRRAGWPRTGRATAPARAVGPDRDGDPERRRRRGLARAGREGVPDRAAGPGGTPPTSAFPPSRWASCTAPRRGPPLAARRYRYACRRRSRAVEQGPAGLVDGTGSSAAAVVLAGPARQAAALVPAGAAPDQGRLARPGREPDRQRARGLRPAGHRDCRSRRPWTRPSSGCSTDTAPPGWRDGPVPRGLGLGGRRTGSTRPPRWCGPVLSRTRAAASRRRARPRSSTSSSPGSGAPPSARRPGTRRAAARGRHPVARPVPRRRVDRHRAGRTRWRARCAADSTPPRLSGQASDLDEANGAPSDGRMHPAPAARPAAPRSLVGRRRSGPRVGRLDPLTALRRRLPPRLVDADGRGRPPARRQGAASGAGPAVRARPPGGRADGGLPAAVAVELVHNFSLLHDDLMDGDAERRHRPTVWTVFGARRGDPGRRRAARARRRSCC